MTVIALLREIAEGTELDPGSRIAELGRRKARIEAEIQSIRAGQLMQHVFTISNLGPAQVVTCFTNKV